MPWTKIAALAVVVASCVTVSHREADRPPDPARQPYRGYVIGFCGGKRVEASGILTCEDQVHSFGASVKVPPLRGRLIASGPDWTKAFDFQGDEPWMPIDFSWDTENRDPEQIIEARVVAPSDRGPIGAKALVYRRTCDWPDHPCSSLDMIVQCDGGYLPYGPREIGTCQRPEGTDQRIGVALPVDAVGKPARLLVAASRLGFEQAFATVEGGVIWATVPKVPTGATVVSLRLVWDDGDAARTRHRMEGRVIVAGYAAEWVPMDEPWVGSERAFAPVGADMIEVDELDGAGNMVSMDVDHESLGMPLSGCAFAWSVASMDMTFSCRGGAPEPVENPDAGTIEEGI